MRKNKRTMDYSLMETMTTPPPPLSASLTLSPSLCVGGVWKCSNLNTQPEVRSLWQLSLRLKKFFNIIFIYIYVIKKNPHIYSTRVC